MATRAKATPDWANLEGKFFHTFCEGGRVASQGQVIGSLGDGYYMVELYDFIVGHAAFTGHQIHHISEMDGRAQGRYAMTRAWAWYSSDEFMRDAYEHGGIAHPDLNCVCMQPKEAPPVWERQ